MTVLDLPRQQHTAPTPLKVELLHGADFAACGWPSIADRRDLAMYVFQSREFLETWASTIGESIGIKPYLLVVRNDGGEPLLYLPLAIETKFNIRFLRFMDHGVADYNAPIVKTGLALSLQEFEALWMEAIKLLPGFDVIDLKKIAGNVAGTFNPLTFLDCTPHGEDGHFFSLEETAVPTGGGISIGQRQKLDREYRKLGELGAVEFVVNPAEERAGPFMEKLFALKRQKYAQTKTADFLTTPSVADFYRDIVSPKRAGKIGHLSALLVDNTVVAAHVGYIGRGRFYYILPAYDAAYARHRPGHLLLRELAGRSAQQGDDTFDLGVGDEAYKQTWATGRLPLYDHERAMTAAGQVYLQMRRVRRFVKTSGIRTSLQTWLRTLRPTWLETWLRH